MASYYRFTKDPLILYGDKILQNFISNYEIRQYNNLTFAEYQVKDEDTPENLALRIYGSSSLSWIILWLNDRIDPFFDWPLKTNEFEKYVTNKYGDELYEPHHYTKGKWIVDPDTVGATMVTNYQYELDLNNQKRNIYLLDPNMIGNLL